MQYDWMSDIGQYICGADKDKVNYQKVQGSSEFSTIKQASIIITKISYLDLTTGDSFDETGMD